MNGTNGNEPGYPENALVPYPVIVAATKGDPDAMKIVLQHFSGYIARLSMRKLYDERGNVYFGVDHDIRERLQAKLMPDTDFHLRFHPVNLQRSLLRLTVPCLPFPQGIPRNRLSNGKTACWN